MIIVVENIDFLTLRHTQVATMGSTSAKLKIKMNEPNGQDSSIYQSQLAHAAFGYVGQLQRKYGSQWEINVLKSPIIYLIIAYFPRRHEIYGIGYNNYGELGLGHTDPILRYTKLNEMSQLLDHTSNLYRGYGRFMIKTLFGELYCCGNNYRGDIGLNRLDLRNSTKFHKIDTNNCGEFFCNIIGDGAISNHTIISSNYPHCNLYAFGSNRRGQFGNYYDDSFKESNYMPVQILYQQILQQNIFHNETIIKIQTGEYHTIFLTEQGNVFSCGDNLYGQCGQYGLDIKKLSLQNQVSNGSSPNNRNKKKQKKAYLPVTKIKQLSDIVDISCGSYHNLCINSNGDLFVFGDNPNGQLAIPLYTEKMSYNGHNGHKNGHNQQSEGSKDVNDNDENIIYRPIKCPFFQQRGIKIAKIETGNCHSLVIDSDSNCWIFGEDKYGQIGTGENNFLLAISTPHSWNSLKKLNGYLVDQASCGYQHTVILTYLNEIFTFGDNEYNQCSSDSKHKKISNPWLLTRFEIGIDEDCRIEKVYAGSDTTLLIIKNN